jgi:DNA-binding NtrC family response regulator
MTPVAHVLVVDDDRRDNRRYSRLLSEAGYAVAGAASVAEALALIEQRIFDVVVLDMLLPVQLQDRLDFGGMEVLRRAKARDEATQVIAVTGYGSRELAAQATAAGAIDYITKDFDTLERLLPSVRAAALKAADLRSPDDDDDALWLSYPDHLIANSPSMRLVLSQAQRLAKLDVAVLITGEPGVGKELIASVLHSNSRPSCKYRVAVCRSMRPGLPELWGDAAAPGGLLEEVADGTLVLRGVELLPFNQQKLLVSLIERREYQPPGAAAPRPCAARVIATAAGDLALMVQRGKFWRPLYDLLARHRLHVPPLRERREDDLAALAGYLLNACELAAGLTDAALRQLLRYDFARDNIRELEQILRHAALQTDGDLIDAGHLPPLATEGPLAPAGPAQPVPSAPLPQLSPEAQEELDHCRGLIRLHRQRIRALETQAARAGLRTDPATQIEIGEIRQQIAATEVRIAALLAGRD